MNALKLRQMCGNAKVRGWKLFLTERPSPDKRCRNAGLRQKPHSGKPTSQDLGTITGSDEVAKMTFSLLSDSGL